jgi:hypothetical protein
VESGTSGTVLEDAGSEPGLDFVDVGGCSGVSGALVLSEGTGVSAGMVVFSDGTGDVDLRGSGGLGAS